ncbi:UCH-domain-containing protein [Sporormia fimetaria CBS 119925]|uniref:ubiquitinyl hydrolase 1 n=1 Tax=Sporormia fimetaria CBS 119925 TaxID=1340428 RepID=A0A6A6VPN5_9PLEO|nr:UCH-domain-containing protein [Sporormia fimetaria CBS 119925]
MDPESAAFQPLDGIWRFQNAMLGVQQGQAELAERVSRLERRHDDDSRLKSVWGTSSSFPSVPGGTPQQGMPTVLQPIAGPFSAFDGPSSSLIGNLHLDADEEPRRIGSTSRANSVRFDETANHGHWQHASRSSIDLIPRTGSGLGGHLMSERSFSHKSEGRQSSAGHSVHSAMSGRANSLNGYGPATPLETPVVPPLFFILGPVPAIMRCWLNTNFKHDTLLYAAVCSGSYASYVDMRLVESLGLQDEITETGDGSTKVKLPVYLSEAVPTTGSSRSSSPTPQLPCITVDFEVLEPGRMEAESKSIQIILGSDVLRAHNADILFSSSQLTLYDDDDTKVQIPLVRPEDERCFKSLRTGSGALIAATENRAGGQDPVGTKSVEQNISSQLNHGALEQVSKANGAKAELRSDEITATKAPEQRPLVGSSRGRAESREGSTEANAVSGAPRPGTSPGIWSNWRREGEKSASMDWDQTSKDAGSKYQRRDTGIKVLKPLSRTTSTGTGVSASGGQSRFFASERQETSDGLKGFDKPKETAKAHRRRPQNCKPSQKPAPAVPRKLVGSGPSHEQAQASATAGNPLHEGHGTLLRSQRSSPLPAARSSASPPRYIPPHMHDEVFDTAQDSSFQARDGPSSVASSPSEAYSRMTLESRESSVTVSADTEQPVSRPPPRSSSPAKRLHSDMEASESAHKSEPGSIRASKGMPSPRHALASPSVAASSNSQPDPGVSLPSLDDQVAKVLALHHTPLKDGQEGYVISERWLERVFARTSENIKKPEQFDKAAVEGEIGPVDNSDLGDPDAAPASLLGPGGEDFVQLRPGLAIGHDFEILPREAWDLIVAWYGLKPNTPVIRRHVHNTALDSTSENLQYELYPPIFTIRKVRKTEGSADTSKTSPRLVASRSDRYVDFLKTAKKVAGIDVKTKVRVWRVLVAAPTDQLQRPQPSGMLTPESSPRPGSPVSATRTTVPLLMDVAEFTGLEYGTQRELVTGKDETANEKYNGRSSLHIAGLAEDQVLILEEQDESGQYITESANKPVRIVETPPESNKTSSKSSDGAQQKSSTRRNSPAASHRVTRGRTRSGRVRGTVGLTNLGNTCYMNSALQCIRSVEELSIYFLEESYRRDLNCDNPLGHGGSIAKAYAGLLAAIYNTDGASSFAPKNFKNALGRAQPLFSGYGQQDSQEFLSFLVDGLHEDLNRIKKKPYTENPESDDNTINDPEAIKALGEKFREIHRARNDSVAMDLFNGFYKNTMVCPDCNKVSITFDPFSALTLQLPIEQTWQHQVTFVPLRGQKVNVDVDIDKHASIKTLKEYIARRFDGVTWDRLMMTEVYHNKFYRLFEDKASLSEYNIVKGDILYFHELDDVPTNWPPRKGNKKSNMFVSASSDDESQNPDSLLAEKVVVPIYHRQKKARYNQNGPVLTPAFIVLTREEAKDYDTILRKVIGKVAQLTTRSILTEFASSSEQSRSGSDIIVTTDEDASPDGDPRVHDGSVEGEDNIVEVTMTDAGVESGSTADEGKIPEVLRPGSFIPPEFRALFDMTILPRSKGETLQTGWQAINKDRFTPLSARIPSQRSRQSSVESSVADANSAASSSDETDDVAQFSADVRTSVEETNGSSDDDLRPLASEASEPFSRGGRQNSRKNRRKDKKMRKKGQQKWSGKNRDRIPQQPSRSFSDTEDEGSEALIRVGEGIVLEWTEEGFDALFGGSAYAPQDQRGIEIKEDVETYEDPELRDKRARRIARKKHGISLEECFTETSKSEILSEDNAWYCGRCKELRRATKTLEIWTAPDILVIHLKRFSGNRAFRDKIDAKVDCPLEGLDLTGKVGLPEGKELVYDLFAVDNHYGGLGGGHYTSCARNFFDGKWYDYNDSIVSPKNPEHVVTPAAYLLFYRRRSPLPLGPPYLQKLVQQFRNPGSEPSSDDEGSESAGNTSSGGLAGNGLRLGDSSRNGSSSDFAAAAGARGAAAGSASLASRRPNAVGAGTADAEADEDADPDAEMLDQPATAPTEYDEGYHAMSSDDDIPRGTGYAFDIDNTWSFANVDKRTSDGSDTMNDNASNVPADIDPEEFDNRMLEDFGDEIGEGIMPGASTPQEDVPPLVDYDSSPVADVVLDDEEEVVGGERK